jgi:hypothetical protein
MAEPSELRDRTAAIKVLPPALTGETAARQRFEPDVMPWVRWPWRTSISEMLPFVRAGACRISRCTSGPDAPNL